MKLKLAIALFSASVLAVSCGSNDPAEKKDIGYTKADDTSFKELRQAIEKFPDSLQLRIQFVDSLREKGMLKEAIQQQQYLIDRDTFNATLWHKKASLLLLSGDTATAIAALRHAITLQPELTEPQVDLGFVFAEMKNPESLMIAERILQSVKDPTLLSRARFMKAIYYYNRKDRQKALAAFNECIVQDYTFLDAYIGKGILLYEQKEYNIASTIFQQAIDISATFAEAWYWQGKCAEAVNNKEKAIEYYQKTIGLDENFEEAKEGLKRLGK